MKCINILTTKPLWIAVLLLYEPGAYGNYQQFLIHSTVPASIEKIYARARQSIDAYKF